MGMSPSKKLWDKSRYCTLSKPPKDNTIGPVRLLKLRSAVVKFFKFPIFEGKEPLNWFEPTNREVNFFK